MFKNYFCNLQTLSENPPLLAPEGFFDEEELQLYEMEKQKSDFRKKNHY